MLRTLTLVATAVIASGGPPRFTSLPSNVAKGSHVTIAAARAKGCRVVIIYKGNSIQDLGVSKVGRWRWHVADDALPGGAALILSCPQGGSDRRTIGVVSGASSTELEVVKSGFSARGPDLSYGVLVRNTSAQTDAVGVRLLVNLVGASNRLLGTRTATIPLIPAGATYALGGRLAGPGGGARVSRLEIVVQGGERRAGSEAATAVADVHVVPSADDAEFLGAVEGEVANADPYRPMQRATISAVILDAAGNVVGGASGVLASSLPGGARQYFSLTSGVLAVPAAKADSALVTVTPSFAG